MKRILSLLLFAMFVSGLHATSVCDKKLVVRGNNGSTGYAVKSIRSIKFINGDIVMNFKDGETVTWLSDAVGCMSFDYYEPSDETMVGGIVEQGFFFDGTVLVVESMTPTKVTLTNVAGKEVVNAVCRGSFKLCLNDYPKGVYILNAGGSIHKIVNR